MEHANHNVNQLLEFLDSFEQYLDVTVDESQDDPALATIEIDASADRITDVLAELLIRLHEHWGDSQKYLVHVKTTQGTGKTTGAMETATYQLGLTAAFGPRHADIEADAEKLRSWEGAHFIGKDSGCINSTYEGKHSSVDPKVSRRWCNNCEKKGKCPVFDPYRELRAQVTNLTGAHEHLLHLPRVLALQEEDVWAQIDTVLIDESPWDAIVEETIAIQLTDINNTIDAVADIRKEEGATYDAELLKELETALGSLKRAIRRDMIADAFDELETHPGYDYTAEQCAELREAFNYASGFARGRSIDAHIEALLTDAHKDYDKDLLTSLREDLTTIVHELWQSDNEKTPFALLREACEEVNDADGLLNEFAERHAEHLEQGISYQNVFCVLAPEIPDILASWERTMAEGRTLTGGHPPSELWHTADGRLELTYLRDDLAHIAASKPTFVLATELPTEKLAAAVDIPVIAIEDNAAPEMEAFQLDTMKAGITTLRESEGTVEKLLELTELTVRREAAEGNTTFVAAKQELVDRIEAYLNNAGFTSGTDFKIGHYYNLTGSNRFEDCAAVVLFGTPRWSDDNVATTRVLTGIPRELLHYEGQDGELRDAIHRTRPLRGPARLYALTNAFNLDEVLADTRTPIRSGIPELRRRLTKKAKEAEKRASLREEVLSFLATCANDPTKTELGTAVRASRHLDAVLEELEINGDIESYSVSNGKPGRDPIKYRALRTST